MSTSASARAICLVRHARVASTDTWGHTPTVRIYYGDVRLMVRPRDAAVYVDGYYAGVVDDFDGVFQRLTLGSRTAPDPNSTRRDWNRSTTTSTVDPLRPSRFAATSIPTKGTEQTAHPIVDAPAVAGSGANIARS